MKSQEQQVEVWNDLFRDTPEDRRGGVQVRCLAVTSEAKRMQGRAKRETKSCLVMDGVRRLKVGGWVQQ